MLTATASMARDEFEDLIEGIVDAMRHKLAASGDMRNNPVGMSNAARVNAEAGAGEKRIERRGRVLMSGKITSGHRLASIDCSIRNMTTMGACVRFEGLHDFPDSFQLYIQREGLVRDAKVVWQKGLTAGLVFSGWEQKVADTDFSDRNSILQFVKSMGMAEH